MVYITEMLPNIWWGYTKINSTNDIDKMYLNKFTSYHKIGDIVKIDEHVSFWNKSTQFAFPNSLKTLMNLRRINFTLNNV